MRRLLVLCVLLAGSRLFAVTADSLIPSRAPRCARVIVAGTSLDAPDLNVTFSAGNGERIAARVVMRSHSILDVVVPAAAVTGPVDLRQGANTVATFPFTLAADPAFVRVTTLAGGAGRPLLQQPSGTFVALPQGNAYIADTSNHRVVAIGPAGALSVVAGTGKAGWTDGPAASAQFHAPEGVAYDRDRQVLYIADTLNHRIRRISSDGIVSTLAGSGKPADADGTGAAASFRQPTGLTIDADGNLYVADTLNHKIRRVTPDGVVTTIAGNGRPSDRDGSAADAGFHEPNGVAIAPSGVLFVVDTRNSTVRRIEGGFVSTVAGTRQAGFADGDGSLAQFHHPEGIAIGDNGLIFIADTKNNRIRAIELSGLTATVTTAAGTGRAGGEDGSPLLASFDRPSAIASAGALYIADTGNNAIRVIEPEVVLTDLHARRGPLTGGSIRLFGAGFVPGLTNVSVGNVPAAATFVSSTLVLVEVPASSAGAVDVSVSTSTGTATLPASYVYLDPPALTLLQPRKGKSAGGEPVTLRGSGFVAGDTTVRLGGSGLIGTTVTDGAAVNATTSVGTTITGTTPAGAHGSVDLTVTTPGGTATLANGFRYFDPPVISSFAPASGSAGMAVTITGSNFDPEPEGNTVRFGAIQTNVVSAAATSLIVTVPPQAVTAPISVTTAGGTVQTPVPFIVAGLKSITVSPANATIETGKTLQFEARGTWADGSVADITPTVTWSSSNHAVATVAAGGLASGLNPGTATISASRDGITGSARLDVGSMEPPPDPATIAPPVELSVTTDFASTTEFLYSGSQAIQRGVVPGAISARRVCVIRGNVIDRDGRPLAGVRVSTPYDPGAGFAVTRIDGGFDFAVNGGGSLVLRYEHADYFPVQRDISTVWNEFLPAPTVAMVKADAAVTTIHAGASAAQVARGTLVQDGDGARQATLIFPAGTQATMTLPNGDTSVLSSLDVRATEYTVGTNGPLAMPGQLPANSGYTYAVELSADEAIAANASSVQFSKPVSVYVENFIGFPVGMAVPTGYFDRTKNAWIPSQNGRVIKVLGVTAGVATLDVSGQGQPASDSQLAALGIDSEELSKLGSLYTAGQSLWRVPITHFTPWDCNWPYGPPAGAVPPTIPQPIDLRWSERSCTRPGSIIDCQNQTLGERIPVAGTDISLHYQSDRTPGMADGRTFRVQLLGAQLPPKLKRVELEISVAGTGVRAQFTPSANLEYTFRWSGRDAYGRPLQGKQKVHLRVGNVYEAEYQEPAQFEQAFARFSGVPITGVRARQEVTLWGEQETTIETWNGPTNAASLWSVSAHHSYDAKRKILYRGDGTRRHADTFGNVVLTTAGTGCNSGGGGHTGDGGPATAAKLNTPGDVAVAPDGGTYVTTFNSHAIRKIDPNGIITTIAGNKPTGSFADGIPAVNARLTCPSFLKVARNGTIYFLNSCVPIKVRSITPDGIIHTVAGSGAFGFGGDGGPAKDAVLGQLRGLEVAPDGTVYITDENRIRRVTPDGRIDTIAGSTAGFSGDGGPARLARLSGPVGLALGPDGGLYVGDSSNSRIRRIGPDGIITTVAGTGTRGSSGDGGPAKNAQFTSPGDLVFAPDGSLYIEEFFANRVRRITPDGIVRTVAGPTIGCDDGLPATRNGVNRPSGMSVDPKGTLYFAEQNNHRLRSVVPPPSSDTLVASEDGSQVYVFDPRGRHLRTVNAWTKTVLFAFSYDSEDRLVSMTDVDGQITRFERDGGGNLQAIVAPAGQRTAITTNQEGWIESIVAPGGLTHRFDYDDTGLLLSYTNPRQLTTHYEYTNGRLRKNTNPAGAFQEVSATNTTTDRSVTVRSPGGLATRYASTFGDGESRQITSPSGTITTFVQSKDGRLRSTTSDGSTMETTLSPNQRFGMTAPDATTSIRMPSGLKLDRASKTTVVLSDPHDPMTVASISRTLTINGGVFTSAYDANARRLVSRTPTGREMVATFDTHDRVVSSEVPGIAPVSYSYDGFGRPLSIVSGNRQFTLGYNDRGEMISMIDPLSRKVTFAYDDAGRIVSQTLPGGRTIGFGYDAAGNITEVTPPGRPAHKFTFTTTDLTETYGAPGATTQFTYDADRKLTVITRPDGSNINFGYDAAGRLASLTTPDGRVDYGYNAASGALTSITPSSGSALSYATDGSLVTGVTWSGPVRGSVLYQYDNHLRLVQENGVGFSYDADGLLTAAGALQLRLDPRSALLQGTTLDKIVDEYQYNDFGEVTAYSATFNGAPLLSFNYTRDNGGRVTAIGNQGFEYDAAGRLARVTSGGAAVAEYVYDLNGNRTEHKWVGGSNAGRYDEQDRLLEYAGATYEYTADGDLKSKTVAGATTTFDYDAAGNLRKAVLPGGKVLEYVIDGQNRRVGKKVNGVLVQGWLYGDQTRIVAQLDGSNAVVSRFVYATLSNAPDYMIKGGVTYRILSDHLGSPRMVVNAADGTVAQTITYDEFGRVLSDSAPGFQPFGFAGGLYDADTGLVRFGARDYDPHVGRWTAKEPLGFAGSLNFYTYSSNDPVNFLDPTGLKEGSASNLKARKAIDQIARKYDGSTDWAYDKVKKPFPANTNKCNLFVADVLDEAGAGTRINGRRPLAGEWGNPKVKIKNWRVLGPNEQPQPGDVAAYAFPNGGAPGASGHTGIMITGPKNTVINTSAHSSGSVYNEPGQFENNPDTVYRRFTGECSCQ